MITRASVIAIVAAGLTLPLAQASAAPVESGKPALSEPTLRAGPRIIHIPEPTKPQPKSQRAQEPQKRPETKTAPHPPASPATPSLRAPVQTKASRKIWVRALESDLITN
jgi:hypothetical protein